MSITRDVRKEIEMRASDRKKNIQYDGMEDYTEDRNSTKQTSLLVRTFLIQHQK